MEKLSKLYPRCVSFLSTQYRSHELISAWSSSYMYGGLLKSHPSVASITLEDLVEKVTTTKEKNNAPALRDPLVFVDTKGMEYYEEVDEGSELMADADKSI
ncbi:Putative dna replication helicase, partial [Caligus rogercresseyi]